MIRDPAQPLGSSCMLSKQSFFVFCLFFFLAGSLNLTLCLLQVQYDRSSHLEKEQSAALKLPKVSRHLLLLLLLLLFLSFGQHHGQRCVSEVPHPSLPFSASACAGMCMSPSTAVPCSSPLCVLFTPLRDRFHAAITTSMTFSAAAAASAGSDTHSLMVCFYPLGALVSGSGLEGPLNCLLKLKLACLHKDKTRFSHSNAVHT